MRTWITLALLVSAALAGCAGEEGTTPTSEPVQDSDDGTNETATSTDTATSADAPEGNETAVNTPPTAELSVDVANGTAPLNVTFTLDGSDEDGDDLTWRLDVNGTEVADGTELPATVTYNFTEAGNFSALLQVTDGANTTAANLTITVSSAAAPPTGPIQEFSDSWETGTPVECQYGFFAEVEGLTWVSTAVVPESIGKAYTASFGNTVPGAYYGISWFDAGGNWLGDHVGEPAGSSITGSVPDSATSVYFWNCAGGVGHSVDYVVPRA